MELMMRQDCEYHAMLGDRATLRGCQFEIIATCRIVSWSLWKDNDGRLYVTVDTGHSFEDGPYYPVLVRFGLDFMPTEFTALGLCLLPMPDAAWRSPVLAL